MDIAPIILCGGAGTRLWPLSRAELPKQLLALAGGAHDARGDRRARDLTRDAPLPLDVTGRAHAAAVAEHLGGTQLRVFVEAGAGTRLAATGRKDAIAVIWQPHSAVFSPTADRAAMTNVVAAGA